MRSRPAPAKVDEAQVVVNRLMATLEYPHLFMDPEEKLQWWEGRAHDELQEAIYGLAQNKLDAEQQLEAKLDEIRVLERKLEDARDDIRDLERDSTEAERERDRAREDCTTGAELLESLLDVDIPEPRRQRIAQKAQSYVAKHLYRQ